MTIKDMVMAGSTFDEILRALCEHSVAEHILYIRMKVRIFSIFIINHSILNMDTHLLEIKSGIDTRFSRKCEQDFQLQLKTFEG
jgi:hypothetical protein